MNTIEPMMKVGQLVAEQPSRSRLFEELGIDYCCGGKRSLGEACASKGLAVAEVIRQLDAIKPAVFAPETACFATMPIASLIDEIVTHHHGYLNRELPRLHQMTSKVARVHGGEDGRLIELAHVYAEFAEELSDHLSKEETILFPAIRLVASGSAQAASGSYPIETPIRVMEAEHQQAGWAMQRMRELTDGFNPPGWACNTYRATLDGLGEMEKDLHEHVHKENNILFPQALALLEKIAAK